MTFNHSLEFSFYSRILSTLWLLLLNSYRMGGTLTDVLFFFHLIFLFFSFHFNEKRMTKASICCNIYDILQLYI